MKAMLFASKSSRLDPLRLKSLQRSARLNGIKIENYDPDDRRGGEIAEVYGVMDFPSVIVLSEDGSVLGSWQGELPTENDLVTVAGYV